MVIHLAGLFENRRDTINFGALISEAERSGTDETAIANARSRMSEVGSIHPKVAILRSNLFGHRSASLSYEDAFEKAAIKPDQIRDLTVAGLDIANCLLAARGLNEQLFHDVPRRDLEKLINDLGAANAS